MEDNGHGHGSRVCDFSVYQDKGRFVQLRPLSDQPSNWISNKATWIFQSTIYSFPPFVIVRKSYHHECQSHIPAFFCLCLPRVLPCSRPTSMAPAGLECGHMYVYCMDRACLPRTVCELSGVAEQCTGRRSCMVRYRYVKEFLVRMYALRELFSNEVHDWCKCRNTIRRALHQSKTVQNCCYQIRFCDTRGCRLRDGLMDFKSSLLLNRNAAP